MARAVVFAYHSVGVRCLAALLARGVEVVVVVTHRDNPSETIWFESVAELAALHDLPTAYAEDLSAPTLHNLVEAAKPDFIFSFYYRHMLPASILGLAARGAYNLHGSLLPKYRGRVPINWAIIHGETETGASLHAMTAKPDAGDLIAQQAVPILPNDTALDVFSKVTVAGEQCLFNALPSLLDGSICGKLLDLSTGSYFSGRKPEDGRIDLTQSAAQVHNLIRAVAPPFPGAFIELEARRYAVLRSLAEFRSRPKASETFFSHAGKIWLCCVDRALRITHLELAGKRLSAADFPPP